MSSDIAYRLSEQTRALVSRFEGRVSSFAGRDDLLGLIRGIDIHEADRFAAEAFGEGEHTAVGVDGSMDFDERLQMMLFYSNATAYSCPFHAGKELTFDLRRVARGPRLSASSAIPLWTEDLSDVTSEVSEIDLELEHTMERVPNAFMTLAEVYLAVKATDSAKIVFLDRPLSGTYATLATDVRFLLRRGMTALSKLSRRSVPSTLLDISLALTLGPPSTPLPGGSRYLKQRLLRELMNGPASQEQLALRLPSSEAQVKRIVRSLRKMDERYKGELLEEGEAGQLKLREGVPRFWERATSLAMEYSRLVFEDGRPPLNLGDDEWLTVLDVNTVTFVLLQRLCEIASTRGILLIGIAKDTTATDIYRAVLPFASSQHFVDLKASAPRLKNDRAFLSVMSSMNASLKIPWRTAGYDSAFSTIVGGPDGAGGFKSARKVVSREQLFVRGFFQSRTLGNNGRIRSQVFLFDRPFDEEDDEDAVRELEVEERKGKSVVAPYYEGGTLSRKSNLILRVLSLTDNPEVYEAFGHNQLLYLADKAVKAEIRQMKGSLRGVAELRLGTMSRREQVFGITTPFRSQRAEAEGARMRAASRGD